VAAADALLNVLDDCCKVRMGLADILDARKHDAHMLTVEAMVRIGRCKGCCLLLKVM
jgi:hypothetical protein